MTKQRKRQTDHEQRLQFFDYDNTPLGICRGQLPYEIVIEAPSKWHNELGGHMSRITLRRRVLYRGERVAKYSAVKVERI